MRPILQSRANAACRRGAQWLRGANQSIAGWALKTSAPLSVNISALPTERTVSSFGLPRGHASVRPLAAAAVEAPVAAEPAAKTEKKSIFLELKTSDESEQLLRIRHSVSADTTSGLGESTSHRRQGRCVLRRRTLKLC